MRSIIQLFKPSFGEEELEVLREPFKNGWIGLGPKTAEFEQKFAQYVGARFAVAMNSATAAIHLAMMAYEIKDEVEVLVPTITFVSTVHAVLYNRAIPVFVDIDPETLCMDVEDMERKITSKTRAVIPVHYGGHPCRMDEILFLAQKYNLIVIEDAAHACGAEYKGKKIGSLSHSTCFSFHAVKNLATGDGGMVTTDDPDIASLLKRLRWMGIDKDTWERTEAIEEDLELGTRRYSKYGWYYEIHELGYKYHMNDINASIGLVQLKKLDSMNAKRRAIVERYNQAFKDISWVVTPVERSYARSACHNYVIKTPFRDELNLFLKDNGIASGVHYMPIHLQPYYRKRFCASVPKAEKVWKELLSLPIYPDLVEDDLNYVIETILAFFKTS